MVSSIEEQVELEINLKFQSLWIQNEVRQVHCRMGDRMSERSEDTAQVCRCRRDTAQGRALLLQSSEVKF